LFFTSGSLICVQLEAIAWVPASGVGTHAHFFGSSISISWISVSIIIGMLVVSISMSFFNFAASQAEDCVGVVLEVVVAWSSHLFVLIFFIYNFHHAAHL